MTADAAGLLLVNAAFLAAGLGITSAVGWWNGARAAASSLGIAYLAGVAAFGVIAQALLVLGGSLDRLQVLLICGVLAAGMLVPRNVKRRAAHISWLWALPIAGMLLLLAVDLWFQPLWAYDSWTFWTPKARALLELNGLQAGWFTSGDLLNRDYPLLLPAVEAAGFRFTGYEVRLLDLQSWFFLVAFAGAFWEIVRPRARGWIAWVVLATVVAAPSIADQLASAEADIPLATFFAGAGLCAYLWLEERSSAALLLFGVLTAAAATTKVEGTIFVLSLTIVATALSLRRWGRAGGSIAAVGAVALLVAVLPWRLWLAAHHVPRQESLGRLTDAGFLADHISRVPYSAAYMAGRIVDPRAWLLLVPLCMVATFAAARAGARSDAMLATGVVALCFLGLVLAYWTTPFELHFHLATSARRVITAPILFWAALAPLLFAAADGGDPIAEPSYPLRS